MTRSLLIISIFILLISNGLIGQNKDAIIKDIRSTCSEIKSNIVAYDTIMANISDTSAEGSKATAYYENETLKLIEVVWLGETGKNHIEYYFDGAELIFVSDQSFTYNRPIYWDKETSKKNGDNEVFDPKKTIVKENKYYFYKEKLFLWLDNDNQEQDLTIGTNAIIGKGLMAHGYKIKSELEK